MLAPRRAEAEFRWRVSSYSPDTGGNCVEVGPGNARVAVRDSKNREAGYFTVPRAAWAAFTRSVV